MPCKDTQLCTGLKAYHTHVFHKLAREAPGQAIMQVLSCRQTCQLVVGRHRLQAAKELEAAEKLKKEARKEAAKKAAANKEATREPGDNKPARANSNPKQSPEGGSGDTPKADAAKGTEDAIKVEAGGEEEEDCTPRDSAGNELAVDIDTSKLTAAQLQEELTKRGMDVKWQPLKGKKVLVDRLQVNQQTCSNSCNSFGHAFVASCPTASCHCTLCCFPQRRSKCWLLFKTLSDHQILMHTPEPSAAFVCCPGAVPSLVIFCPHERLAHL